MFTGLIENLGQISKWQPSSSGGRLHLTLKEPWDDLQLGESIAINGCCLTVVEFSAHDVAFDVSDETLRKTTLGKLQQGQWTNMERAMRVGDRLGGHFVLGHVDAVGQVEFVKVHDGSVEYRLSCPASYQNLLIEKGSVTVDGISLTVCDLVKNSFSVYIIPHTLDKTILKNLVAHQNVNLEFDVLGKYILRQQENQRMGN